jgi:hypothetical protein
MPIGPPAANAPNEGAAIAQGAPRKRNQSIAYGVQPYDFT